MKAWNDATATNFTSKLNGINKSVAASMLALQLRYGAMDMSSPVAKAPSAYHAPASSAPKAGEGFSATKSSGIGKSGPPRTEFSTDKGTFTFEAVTPKSGIIPPKPVTTVEFKPNSPGKQTGKQDWMSIKAPKNKSKKTPKSETVVTKPHTGKNLRRNQSRQKIKTDLSS